MDFEQQLEKAERLESPSLVGSSLRSADDSPHNNYIHPEKYKPRTKKLSRSLMNSQIGASLDDLISEGALLGSEEDFELFLDGLGHVKEDARLKGELPLRNLKAELHAEQKSEQKSDLEPKNDAKNDAKNEVKSAESASRVAGSDSLPLDKLNLLSLEPKAESGIYSTPNLSEYQLEHLIKDHSEMLSYVKSHNLNKLPGYHAEARNPQLKHEAKQLLALPTASSFGDSVAIHSGPSDGLHSPYFQHDSRSRSRSQNRARASDRSRSQSAVKPHLARGDSYKNIHEDEPSKYELPSNWEPAEEEANDGDRRSRQSKPTLRESVAAAEAARAQQQFHDDTRASLAASLLTTGDYTNFNVDVPEPSSYYTGRSASATNYLRSISRSRSRQPDSKRNSRLNEKNDADPEELISEGALVTDDPYSSINHLDTMMEEVLSKKKDKESKAVSKDADSATPVANDSESKKEEKEKDEEEKEKKEEEVEKEEVEKEEVEKEEEVKGKELFDLDKTDQNEGDNESKVASDNEKETSGGPSFVGEKKVELVSDLKNELNSVAVDDQDQKDIPSKQVLKLANDKIAGSITDTVKVQDSDETNTDEDTKVVEELKDTPAKKTLITDYSEPISQDAVPEDKEPTEAKSDDVVGETLITQPIEELEHSKEEEPEDIVKTTEVPVMSSRSDAESAIAFSGATKESSKEEQGAEELETAEVPKDEDEEKEVAEPEASAYLKKANNADAADDEPETVAELKDLSKAPEVAVKEVDTEKEEEGASVKEVSNEEPELATKEAETGKEDAIADTEESSKEPQVVSKELDAEKEEVSDAKELDKEPFVPSKELDTEKEDPAHSKGLSTEPETVSKEVETKKEEPAYVATADIDEDDLDISPEELRKHLESQPVYIFTSFAGGMQIVHRTNRLATILKGNGIEFTQRDLGTDDEAKKIWRRYSGGKTLPGVVRGDDFIGNWEEIDEANEDYRVRELVYETL